MYSISILNLIFAPKKRDFRNLFKDRGMAVSSLLLNAPEPLFEILTDSGFKQFVACMEKSGVLVGVSCFCADGVSKMDRS
jgi:hypothetical protein